MALYDERGHLFAVFDSTRALDIIMPYDPNGGPITETDLAAAALEVVDNENDPGETYFIGGDVGAIKIGRSTRLAIRFKDIQACSPIPLRILAVRKGASREKLYHDLLAPFRLHGEWFERHPTVLAEIARLTPIPKDKSHG